MPCGAGSPCASGPYCSSCSYLPPLIDPLFPELPIVDPILEGPGIVDPMGARTLRRERRAVRREENMLAWQGFRPYGGLLGGPGLLGAPALARAAMLNRPYAAGLAWNSGLGWVQPGLGAYRW